MPIDEDPLVQYAREQAIANQHKYRSLQKEAWDEFLYWSEYWDGDSVENDSQSQLPRNVVTLKFRQHELDFPLVMAAGSEATFPLQIRTPRNWLSGTEITLHFERDRLGKLNCYRTGTRKPVRLQFWSETKMLTELLIDSDARPVDLKSEKSVQYIEIVDDEA